MYVCQCCGLCVDNQWSKGEKLVYTIGCHEVGKIREPSLRLLKTTQSPQAFARNLRFMCRSGSGGVKIGKEGG